MIPLYGITVIGGYTFYIYWVVFTFATDVLINIQRDSLSFIY